MNTEFKPSKWLFRVLTCAVGFDPQSPVQRKDSKKQHPNKQKDPKQAKNIPTKNTTLNTPTLRPSAADYLVDQGVTVVPRELHDASGVPFCSGGAFRFFFWESPGPMT